MSKSTKIVPPTTKDLFAQKITNEIFNYRKKFGVLTFVVKFNSGVASSLIINAEERICLDSLHKNKSTANQSKDLSDGTDRN